MSRSSAWSTFWKTYHSGGYSQRPSLFRKNEYPGLSVTAAAIFDAAVTKCDQFRNLPRSQRIMFSQIRLYLGGQRIQDPGEYLMQQPDGDFAGWCRRLETVADDYCVVFNRLESAFDDAIWGVYELLQPLLDELGMPARRSEITLFAGRYKKTPFGIHRDDELNFFWPLIGPKRVRFWSPEYGNANPGLATLVDYDEHLAQSFTLDAQAGDMLAWPGNWWHIAEGGNEFSTSMTIPLEWYSSSEKIDRGEVLQRIAKVLVRAAAAHSGSTLIPPRVEEDSSEKMPEMIFDAASLFSGICAEDVSDLLTEQWLRKMTTAGLGVANPVRNGFVKIDENQLIRRVDGGPIRWAKLSRGKICIANGGRAVRLPYSVGLVEIIGQLNTAKSFSIGSLADHVSSKTGDSSPVAVAKFALTVLAKIGAVELAGVQNP